MKTWFFGDLNANLTDTTLNFLIRPIKLCVTINATVQNSHQLLRQRVTYSKPTTTKRHSVKVYHILFHTLRIPTHVVHFIMIILRQHHNQVVGEENGVVITHDKPPHVFQPQLEALFHNPRHANGGSRPVRARVPERRRVTGHLIRR